MNSTWRESGDQKGWVQQSPWVRRRSAGIGVGVGLGTGLDVGDGLGAGLTEMLSVAQPVTTETVSRAQTQNAWIRLGGHRVSIVIRWGTNLAKILRIVC